jgi:beta-lactam-binding protein with PASTA domain
MEAAKAAIELAELNFVKGKAVDSDLPAGTAASSNPGAGASVPRGTDVVGPYPSNGEATSLPDVKGLQINDAKNQLAGEGWDQCGSANAMCRTSARRRPWARVYAMDPSAGAVINRNSVVTLH